MLRQAHSFFIKDNPSGLFFYAANYYYQKEVL